MSGLRGSEVAYEEDPTSMAQLLRLKSLLKRRGQSLGDLMREVFPPNAPIQSQINGLDDLNGQLAKTLIDHAEWKQADKDVKFQEPPEPDGRPTTKKQKNEIANIIRKTGKSLQTLNEEAFGLDSKLVNKIMGIDNFYYHEADYFIKAHRLGVGKFGPSQGAISSEPKSIKYTQAKRIEAIIVHSGRNLLRLIDNTFPAGAKIFDRKIRGVSDLSRSDANAILISHGHIDEQLQKNRKKSVDREDDDFISIF